MRLNKGLIKGKEKGEVRNLVVKGRYSNLRNQAHKLNLELTHHYIHTNTRQTKTTM